MTRPILESKAMKTILPILLAAAIGFSLTACAAKEPLTIQAADTCLPVPKCTVNPPAEIKTNADLVYTISAYKTAFQQCRLYRDTLAACLHSDEETEK